MTITNSQVSQTWQGNGAASVFSYSFLIPEADQCALIVTDPLGHQTTLSLGQFSGTFNNPAGGVINYPLSGAPLAAGYSLTLVRQVPYEQDFNPPPYSPVDPAGLMQALDNIEMQIQQLRALGGPQGPPGPTGPAGPPGVAPLYILASTVSGGAALAANSVGAFPARADSYGDALLFVGIALQAGVAGSQIEVAEYGLVPGIGSGWTSDQPVFLGQSGGLTQVVPNAGISFQIGVAVSATDLFLRPDVPVQIS